MTVWESCGRFSLPVRQLQRVKNSAGYYLMLWKSQAAGSNLEHHEDALVPQAGQMERLSGKRSWFVPCH
jgi:hypothetical protein